MKKDEESLTITNINEGDQGTYTCLVKTEIDEDSASARLTVLGTHTHTHTKKNFDPRFPNNKNNPVALK